ncbi:FadR/GntR family transcriptional regulator [Zhihengliuella salsuginis]|uniref:Transcriptional regulator n=1 Tax=Zhihengliuella salsuginis TaxID=578222 RepID=A0ABQ3GB23_9MICC|nr:FCD domain-containing protein [Zhihengliuella salsuginis]GHD00193.1 transcriptional regulator [Zhihengliuella salsuginis]
MNRNAAKPATPRAYETVLQGVEADLRSGNLKLGDQLPGERALAEKHGISRASVRDAIRILDVMGVVRTSTGSGPSSGAVIISRPAAGISTALRMHIASAQLSIEEIVQTRVLLEMWAAQSTDLAAAPERAADVLAEAEALLEEMESPGVERQQFHDLDARFHVLLASLAGNAVIEAMMESLRLAIRDYVADSVSSDESWSPVVAVLKEQHRGIFDAVTGGRGDQAAELLREHIEWFHREVR